MSNIFPLRSSFISRWRKFSGVKICQAIYSWKRSISLRMWHMRNLIPVFGILGPFSFKCTSQNSDKFTFIAHLSTNFPQDYPKRVELLAPPWKLVGDHLLLSVQKIGSPQPTLGEKLRSITQKTACLAVISCLIINAK